MQSNRSDVRRLPSGSGEPGRLEDFDGDTGSAKAPGLRRKEVEADARSCSGDRPSPTPVILRLGPAEVSALRDAIEMYLFLEMIGGGRSILEGLYAVFASWAHGDSGELAAVTWGVRVCSFAHPHVPKAALGDSQRANHHRP